MSQQQLFPFTAIVGQDKMKTGLLLNVIDPLIGGVLLTGHQGTGKSTAVRSLVDILPEIDVVEGCPFNCDPSWVDEMLCDYCKGLKEKGALPIKKKKMDVINLPLGSTEDMISGTLDIEKVIHHGVRALHPGLLARANRQILYVDEINLLSDHLLDLLLDAAASGVNIVEREGVSIMHPSRFILVGSMNPEEGELRPQISDRLGLEVDVEASKSPKERAEITKKVLSFSRDSKQFMDDFSQEQGKMKGQVANAREILDKIVISDTYYEHVSRLITELNIISHRADIVFVRCARAHAALEGRTQVNKDDFKIAFELALGHRLKNISLLGEQEKDISDRVLDIYGEIEEAIENEDLYQPGNQEGPLKHSEKEQSKMEITPLANDHPELPDPEQDQRTEGSEDIPPEAEKGEGMRVGTVPRGERLDFQVNETAKKTGKRVIDILKILQSQKLNSSGRSKGKRYKVMSRDKGRYVTFRNPPPRSRPKSVAIDATLKYALMGNLQSTMATTLIDPGPAMPFTGGFQASLPLKLSHSDVKEKVFEYKSPLSLYFVLDASASMANTLFQMKQVIDSLHQEGYKKKDKVAVVMFRGKQAHVIQKPSINLEAISKKLETIKGVSYTPLAEGIEKVLEMVRIERIKDSNSMPVVIIVSDCGANISKKYPNLVAQLQEDYKIIVDEMRQIATRMGMVRNLKTIIVLPKKSYALRHVGVNPFVQMRILKDLKEKAGAVVFEFSGSDKSRIFLKQML